MLFEMYDKVEGKVEREVAGEVSIRVQVTVQVEAKALVGTVRHSIGGGCRGYQV